ncbi:MAG: MFS transporter [Chloroflexia bacterium]|nr:MFS transporter [Chloroflexia bacterium]
MIVITIVAFEGLALTTVTPVIADALGGLSLYVWISSTYLLAQLVGSVWAGREIDRRGLAMPFAVSHSLFGAGLVVAAAAQRMEVLVVGRALQGLGAGALANCTYTSVNLGYADALRPRMFAAISAAYIVPAIAGPYAAALLAERLTWRSVFLVLLPLLPVAALLALPAYRRLTAGGNVANGGATGRGRRHAARWRRYTSRSSWPLPRGGGRGALRLAATQSPAERHLLNPPGPACVTRRARCSQPPSSPRRPTWYWRSPGSQGTPKAQPDWL